MRHPEPGPSRARARSRATSTSGRSWSTRPTTGAIETNAVTDPYSVALTPNSERSVAIDLGDKAHTPKAWEKTKAPVDRPAGRPDDLRAAHPRLLDHRRDGARGRARHVPGVHPRRQRGHDAARAARRCRDEHGAPAAVVRHRDDRGEPRRSGRAAVRPRVVRPGVAPSSRRASTGSATPTASTGATTRTTSSHPRARTRWTRTAARASREFRSMVGALHETGLQVVLDEVFNHTAAVGPGRALGARPGRARLLPAPQRCRRRRDLDVLPERGDRARRRRRSSWSTRWSRGPATTRSTASASI